MEVLNVDPSEHFMKRLGTRRDIECYDQLYKGLPVIGGGYVFHKKNGIVEFIDGKYHSLNGFDASPVISKEDAMRVYAEYRGIPVERVESYSSKLYVVPPLDELADITNVMLVYHIFLFANIKGNDEVGMVDAKTGRVINSTKAFSHSITTTVTISLTQAVRLSSRLQTSMETNIHILVLTIRKSQIMTITGVRLNTCQATNIMPLMSSGHCSKSTTGFIRHMASTATMTTGHR